MQVHDGGHPNDNPQPGESFKKGFNAEILKEHLEKRIDRPEQDAVEFSFHDVGVTEFIEVQAQDVEQAEGDEREAVEKNNLPEAPAAQIHFPKQDIDKHKCKNSRRCARCKADEEIASIADADFQELDKVLAEEAGMKAKRLEETIHFAEEGLLAAVNRNFARRANPPGAAGP